MNMLLYLFIIVTLLCSTFDLLHAGRNCAQGACAFDQVSSFQSAHSIFTGTTITTETTIDNDRIKRVKACDDCQTTLFLPRPQYLDSAALFNSYYYDSNGQVPCFSLDFGYRFNQTFKGQRIAECLFGDSTLSFSGSKVRNRSKHDIVADYFGLAPDFKGSVSFDPRIQNHILDGSIILELGPWCSWFENSYFKINSSFVHTTWDLRPRQTIELRDDNRFSDFPECYMSAFPEPAAGDIQSALSGNFTFGDMNQEWRFGRFIFRGQSKTGLANVDLILGHDFVRCENWHFGAFFKATAPTGTTPNAETVFEPIIGNGHHWEVGGGLDAHWLLCSWSDQSITLYFTGCATHLFDDIQFRSFDLRPARDESSCLSRYILLK